MPPSSAPPQADIKQLLGLDPANKRRRRVRSLLMLAVLAVMVAGWAWWASHADSTSRQTAWRTDEAIMADVIVIVTATGTIEPTNRVDVSSELSGIIRSVAVDFNARIQRGQVLAELDTDRLEATLASSRARVNSAAAHVAEAVATVTETRADLARKRTLADRGLVSSQELETRRAGYERAVASAARARADLEAVQAELKLNETNLAKACICSPIDGVVLDRNVEPGQVVASSLQAPVLFTIAEDLARMEVWVDVDEADIGRVSEGQQAMFTVDAFAERRFKARIRTLRYGSQVVQGVVTYKAVLDTDNADLLLRPGMTATAEITVLERNNVLTVSNEALRFTPAPAGSDGDDRSFLKKLLPGMPKFRPASQNEQSGSTRRVWVVQDGQPVALPVTIGATDGRRTQVVSGSLNAGQSVIIDEPAAAR